jgi:endonuclease/exonuclease/phosphatase (EEP) superfamily protein YafD
MAAVGRFGHAWPAARSAAAKPRKSEETMVRIGCLAVLLLAGSLARAQDVAGIELCTHESRMDRRTGCLQSNVDYLHKLIAKNAADAQQKLSAAAGEISALKATVATLQAAVAAQQASVDKLQAAARKPDASKPDAPASKPNAK